MSADPAELTASRPRGPRFSDRRTIMAAEAIGRAFQA